MSKLVHAFDLQGRPSFVDPESITDSYDLTLKGRREHLFHGSGTLFITSTCRTESGTWLLYGSSLPHGTFVSPKSRGERPILKRPSPYPMIGKTNTPLRYE